MHRFSFLSFLAIAFLAGCGSGTGGSGSKLSTDQKGQLGSTLEAVGRTQEAPVEAQKNLPAAELAATTAPDKQKQMASRLVLARCRIVTPNQQPGAAPDPSMATSADFHIQVTGTGCPIAMNFLVKYHIDFQSSGASGNIDVSYKVMDKEFEGLNDITAMEMKGSWGSKLDQQAKKQVDQADMKGSFTSKELGLIPVVLVGRATRTEKNVDETTTLSLKFPAFTAELRKVLSGNAESPKEEYFINEEKVSKQEFSSYLKKSGNIFPSMASR